MISFSLNVSSSNEGVRTRDDVAWMLEDTARKLREGIHEGNVRDINGNTVGTFKYNKRGGPSSH